MKPRVALFLVFIGGIFFLMGMSFIGMYLWEGVISRIGEPDQSLVFWYLPILFLGIMGIRLGWFIFRKGLRQIRSAKKVRLESSDIDP